MRADPDGSARRLRLLKAQARTRWDLDVGGADPDGFARRRRGYLELGCGFTRTLSTAFEAFYNPWRPTAGHSAF